MKYRSNRFPTHFKVAVLQNGEKRECTIVNISESGAKLHNLRGASIGDQITISSNFGKANAEVRWVKDKVCGIEFGPKLSSQMVGAFRRNAGFVTTLWNS